MCPAFSLALISLSTPRHRNHTEPSNKSFERNKQERIQLITRRPLRPPTTKLLIRPSRTLTPMFLLLMPPFILLIPTLTMLRLVLNLIFLLPLDMDSAIPRELGRSRRFCLSIRSLVIHNQSISFSDGLLCRRRRFLGSGSSPTSPRISIPFSSSLLFFSPFSPLPQRSTQATSTEHQRVLCYSDVAHLTESLLSRFLVRPLLHLLPSPTSSRSSTTNNISQRRIRFLQPYLSRWFLVDRSSLSPFFPTPDPSLVLPTYSSSLLNRLGTTGMREENHSMLSSRRNQIRQCSNTRDFWIIARV